MRDFKKIIFAAAFILLSLFAFSQKYNPLWVDGRIYFKLSDYASLNAPQQDGKINPNDIYFLKGLVDKYQIEEVSMPFMSASSQSIQRTLRMDFGAIDKIKELIKDLSQNPDIEYAEPAPLFFISSVPDDPYYNQELSYSQLLGGTINVNSSWHLNLINADEAWEETTGNSEVIVAVLDNAIWTDHPDLTNSIHESSTDLGDGDDNPNPPSSTYIWSHGTHSAGLIAAENNNGIGVASIGGGVSIMAVKLGTDASDGQSMAAGFEGIVYAADHGADVINMSWGSPQFFQTMQNIVNYAYNKGCVMLGAAGNNGNGAETQAGADVPVNYTAYPAALEHVIAVGSCNVDDVKSDFSCYGTWIDILSPGGYGYQDTSLGLSNFSVLSTTYNTAGTIWEYIQGGLSGDASQVTTGGAGSFGIEGNYDIMQGTSMACPVAAGLCGLILSKNPTLTPEELTSLLKSTCANVDSVNTQFVDSIGAGRIDAYASVHAAGLLSMDLVADFTASEIVIATGESINFTDLTIGTPTSWTWEFEGGTPSTSTEQNPQNIVYNEEGIYQVRLTVNDGTNTDVETKTYYLLVGQSSSIAESAWEEQNTHFATAYRASYYIDIVNANTVWTVTMDGTSGAQTRDFAVTTDGGTTWIPKTFNFDTNWSFADISALDGTTAWVATFNASSNNMGAVFKTTDAGETWTRQGENMYPEGGFLNVIHFFNENEGYCQGDPVNNEFEIYKTTDGGENWTAVDAANIPDAQSSETSTVSLDDACGDIAWFGTTAGRIFKTSDKGETWTVLNTGTSKMISSLSFADEQNGAVTCVTYNQTTGATSDWEFLKTTDGGNTWTPVPVANEYLTSFSLVPGTPGMIVGTKSASTADSCFSAYSTDWGTSWTQLDDSIQYLNVKMLNDRTGWAGGFNWDADNGGIYKWKGIDVGLHFTSIPVTTIPENMNYRYIVEAENDDSCTISLDATMLPEWLTFSNNASDGWVLEGTAPSVNSLSEDFEVVITATDCNEAKTQSFTITVTTTNTAPEFTSEPITQHVVNTEYVYNITATDAENDDLAFTSGTLPSWATLTDNGDGTATLSGTPTFPNPMGVSINLMVSDGINTTTQRFTLFITRDSGIEDFGNGQICIYPNPCNEKIFIENCQSGEYEIFDINGQIVKSGTINNSAETIDISSQTAGTYIIRIYNNDSVFNKEIIKY